MLVQHSQPILFHRMALSETGSLGASHALVAKYRGEQMVKEAIARLDAVGPMSVPAGPARVVDKVA